MPIFRQVPNYEDPQAPKYEGNLTVEAAEFGGRLKVVSYNIDKGRQVAWGIRDLQEFSPLQGADVILLQEMDEVGVRQMAEVLGCNYVYYPASVLFGQNFGNAVLTRWPITRAKKVILPHRRRDNGQMRIAVRADLSVDGRLLLVYCAHTEIYTASIRHRRNQTAALIADIPPEREHVMVGGDFNTVSGRSIRRLAHQFAEAGFQRATAGAGATVIRALNAADHIFTSGFEVIDRGKVKEARASDHYPVWADLAWRS